MNPFRTLGWALALACAGDVAAQVSSAPQQGLATHTPRHASIVDARIVVRPGEVIANGSLEVRDGLVVGVRSGRHVAPGALVVEAAGKTLWPAFIDVHGSFGIDATARCRQSPAANGNGALRRGPFAGIGAPQAAPSAPSALHWNDRVCPERDVSAALALDGERAKALRRIGFGASNAAPGAGVLRGQGALLSLRDAPTPQQNLLAARVAQHASFEADFSFSGVYPGSKMGAIALIRQALLDSGWQRDLAAWQALHGGERAEANAALDALQPVLAGRQLLLFDADDELDVVRAARIADEFGLRAAVLGIGTEYRVLDQLPPGIDLVLPLNFPRPPAVEDAEAALELSLAELEHWRYAPYNPARVAASGRRFALTLAGLEKPEDGFWPALRRAVKYGLSEDQALAALTTTPAALLGESRLGTLEAGRIASFVIADAGLFHDEDARIFEVWVDGARDQIVAPDAVEIAGRWSLRWSGAAGPAEWTLEGKAAALKLKAGEHEGNGKFADGRLLLTLPAAALGGAPEEKATLEAALLGTHLSGRWIGADGRARPWSGERVGPAPAQETRDGTKAAEDIPPFPVRPRYPAGEYGRDGLPAQSAALAIRGATVWMTGAAEPLAATDVLIERGRIRALGAGLKAPRGAVEIDAHGLHLTPGLIDAHSHIGVSGNVNEPSHAITSEVRIGDVIDPTDINLYRELAGGTTTSHLMHGSANPIGGQSQIVKHRWGADAEGLKFEGATPSIKFALGENVKQSNWGAVAVPRYPQTRMGVEQVFDDAFVQARAYAAARGRKGGPPQRRDLRMQALAEILAGERLVHIHSYRQDEILMFARLSADKGFQVAAFQHVLEGYKVADVLADTGAGASTFADWWGYKMETWDGIPYNAAILHRRGVLTSVNSDSNDLGRRLNTEAGKAGRYGGLSDTEALAMVTLNPARQLRIDARVGSIEPGKDADLVLWSQHPLSSYARPLKVWIDGREYFNREADLAEQQRIAAARAELIQAALAQAAKSGPPDGADGPGRKPRTPIDPTRYRVLDSRLAALRGAYHNGEAVHYCQGEH
ncbi:MAG: amidohydrolase family protein [Xanthomonadales bacterium]|nr:Adenine deaminase [Xanthomonadales bacterium]MCC6592180.1 amidohydrolase family protein [Xanthomonadales bacterium]MCE7930319.1 amidohydrolase [Xanthomonadales bacterium PRO6]